MNKRRSKFPIQGKTGDMNDSEGHLRIVRDGEGNIFSAYSYDLQIVAALPGKPNERMTVGNAATYSMTTARHQAKAGVRNCDIVIVGKYDPDHKWDGPVPGSRCGDLITWYEQNKHRPEVKIERRSK